MVTRPESRGFLTHLDGSLNYGDAVVGLWRGVGGLILMSFGVSDGSMKGKVT